MLRLPNPVSWRERVQSSYNSQILETFEGTPRKIWRYCISLQTMTGLYSVCLHISNLSFKCILTSLNTPIYAISRHNLNILGEGKPFPYIPFRVFQYLQRIIDRSSKFTVVKKRLKMQSISK